MAKPSKAIQAVDEKILELRNELKEVITATRLELVEMISDIDKRQAVVDKRSTDVRATFNAHLPLLEKKIQDLETAVAEITEKQGAELVHQMEPSADSVKEYGVTATGKKYLLEEWTTTKVMQILLEKKLANLNLSRKKDTSTVLKWFDPTELKLCMCLHCFKGGASPEMTIHLNNTGAKMHRKNRACANPFPSVDHQRFTCANNGKSQRHKVYDESAFHEKTDWVAVRLPGAYYAVKLQASFCVKSECYVWHCVEPTEDLDPIGKFVPADDNLYAWLQQHVADYTTQAAVQEERVMEREEIERYLRAVVEQDSDGDDSIATQHARSVAKRRAEYRDAEVMRAEADAAGKQVEEIMEERRAAHEVGNEDRVNELTVDAHRASRKASDLRGAAAEAELAIDCSRAGAHGNTKTLARRASVQRVTKKTLTHAERVANSDGAATSGPSTTSSAGNSSSSSSSGSSAGNKKASAILLVFKQLFEDIKGDRFDE